MNLREFANSSIQRINPNCTATWVRSNGYATDAAGRRIPVTASQVINIQVQALSAQELFHLDGLNIQGVRRSVHMYGNPQGIVRVDAKGGDILQFPEISGGPIRNWLVVQVMETWPNWSRVAVCLQKS